MRDPAKTAAPLINSGEREITLVSTVLFIP
jgi:hypothetical protein